MVVVDANGEPIDNWQQALAQQLSEYMAPVWAPIVDQMNEAMAPMRASIVSQLNEAMAPTRELLAAHISSTLFTPEFRAALERMRQHLPGNWPEEIDLNKITAVIQDDGLPLVWVPPADVVAEVLDAPDRDARLAVLRGRADKLVQDCRRVLGDVRTERLGSQLPLAPRALDAFEAGHHEAAQALAVVVIDATMAGWITGKFEAVEAQVRFDPAAIPFDMVRLQAAVAPLRNFKQRYFAGLDPRPLGLNRQVTVHYADAEHFTKDNALVACLLMTSVLRALQDFEERYQGEAA